MSCDLYETLCTLVGASYTLSMHSLQSSAPIQHDRTRILLCQYVLWHSFNTARKATSLLLIYMDATLSKSTRLGSHGQSFSRVWSSFCRVAIAKNTPRLVLGNWELTEYPLTGTEELVLPMGVGETTSSIGLPLFIVDDHSMENNNMKGNHCESTIRWI
jgi:hypothetical protein